MSKYHNVRTSYADRVYHSGAEAAHARTLDLLKRAGEVSAWEPQVRIPLVVNGQHVCSYIADFAVTFSDGHCELQEVKGFQTPVWRLKRRLLEATWLKDHPDVELVVIGASRRGSSW